MTTKPKQPSRLRREMLAMAKEMHAIGTMDDATFRKITMRDLDRAEAATLAPLTGDEIRALREQANMSSGGLCEISQPHGWLCLAARARREASERASPRFAQCDPAQGY